VPATLLAWRPLVTAVVLLPQLLRARGRLDRRSVCGPGGGLPLLCQGLYLSRVCWAAAAEVPAGTPTLISSLQRALAFAAAVLQGNERHKLGHVAGLVLGPTGLALTAAAGDPAGDGSHRRTGVPTRTSSVYETENF
jgi:drug/metabolite transporter (DMT)-like permease